MKLSSFAFLFSAAVAALSGASATTDIDTEVSFVGYVVFCFVVAGVGLS